MLLSPALYKLIITYGLEFIKVDTIRKIGYNPKAKGGRKMFDAIMVFVLDIIDLIKVIINVFG